ncbi:MAG: TolC family protein [bacterium]|nr:TolC family protein [bacterium]
MKHIKNLFISLLVATIVMLPAFALEDLKEDKQKTFSVEQCIKYALEHNEAIKIAKNMVKIQKSRVGQAKSDYFPRLGLGNGYTFSDRKTKGMHETHSNTYDVDLSVNQLIWNFGKTAANINMQKYNAKSAQYDLEDEILNITYGVKIAYYGVLAAKANVDISQQTVRINELNYERTKALFEEGLKSKIDVVNSEVYYTDAQVQLLDTEHRYEMALIELAEVMDYHEGIDFSVLNTENFNFKPINYQPEKIDIKYVSDLQDGDNSELVLTSGIQKNDILKNFDFKPYDGTVHDAIETAYKQRPDLKSLELVLKASGESLKAIKRSYYPELGASAGYGFSKGENTHSNNFRVYAGLDFPIINVMNIKYKIDEGKAYYEIAEDNLHHAKHHVYFEISDLYVSMKQLEKKIPLMQQKVAQTLENFELADGRYTVGLGNFIELQDAQTNYNKAQLEFVQTIFTYNVAREEFFKAMGVQ